MAEQKPIPRIAMTASQYAQAEWQRTLKELAVQTVEAMGLDPKDNWHVDFGTGLATKQTPDISPENDAA